MGIIGVILGFLGWCFFAYIFEDAKAENQLKKCTMSFEDICKKSSVLCVSQYSLNDVQIQGVSTSYKLNSRASEMATEICKEYGFRLVNAEGARVFHLAKI